MAFGNATKGYVRQHSGGGGGGGTSNYNDLSNKPSINGVTLTGNKSSADLGITASLQLMELEQYASDPISYVMPENYTVAIFIFKYQSSFVTLVCPKTMLDNLANDRSQTISLDLADGSRNNKLMKNGDVIMESSNSTGVYHIDKVYYF